MRAKVGHSKASERASTLLLAGLLGACASPWPLVDLPCPCAAGWTCCEPTGRCVEDPGACDAGGQGGDGGSGGDAGTGAAAAPRAPGAGAAAARAAPQARVVRRLPRCGR